jgi:hypothetical protein
VAESVRVSHQAGRNVIVRVDYAEGQNLPPSESSLSSYVSTLTTICQNADFRNHAWGYIIGNEPNASFENSGLTPMTPSWYARVFCGFGTSSNRTDNALQTIRGHQPSARVLIGAVGPWNTDANGSPAFTLDCPWLNYFNEMCQHIGEAMVFRGLGAVDGCAIHTYGRVGTSGTLNGGKNEPHNHVQAPPPSPPSAWFGFTTYKNRLDVIDSHDLGGIAGSPIWITETNTRTDAPSKDSYPSGWYIEALKQIYDSNASWERIMSVCWFVDRDYGDHWPDEALTDPIEKCEDADDDFNQALVGTPY